jgi:uncharacterized membrane protein
VSGKDHAPVVRHKQRYIITGILALVPLLITWLVLEFLFDKLEKLGRPWVPALYRAVSRVSPDLAEWLFTPWVENALAILLTFVVLYLLGWAATRMLGRRLLGWFETLFERIPLVRTIYGSAKMLVAAFQTKPQGTQRVVIIEFPSPGLRTIGFVTRVMVDEDSGEEFAAVYVPTSPNPTSGYMEIIPLADVIETSWSMDEGLRFVMTAGTSGPETVRLRGRSRRSRAEHLGSTTPARPPP